MWRLTGFALAAPRRVLLGIAGITLLLAAGAPRSHTEFGYRPLVGGDHAAIRRLESFVERFAGGFPVRIAWRCGENHPCVHALDPISLEMAWSVASALAAESGVRDVQSPATSTLLVPAPDGFAIRHLVRDGRPAPDLERLAERARQDRLWRGELLSEDARTGVIVVQLTDSSSATSERVMEAVDRALAPHRAGGFEFHLVGHAVEFVVAGRELADSSAGLVPITALVIAVVILALSRSILVVLLTMGTMGVALVWTFGLLGWLGWPQDSILQTLAPLILVVGVCDAIHVLARHSEELSRVDADTRDGRAAALLAAARDTGGPCLVTTLTTAAALASFATSELETFVRFGVVSAFGVISCIVLTFTLLPIGAVALPQRRLRVESLSRSWRIALEGIVLTAQRRAVPILAATLLVFLVCGLGWATRLRVDTDGYEMYGERSRVIGWIRFFEDHFGRSDDLELEVSLPDGRTVADPPTLERIAALTHYLEGEAQLGPTRSVLDLLAWLNRLLHDDDRAFEHPPEDPAVAAQLLELASFEDPEYVSRWVTLDHAGLRLSVEAPFLSYAERGRVLERVESWAAAQLPAGWGLSHSGPFSIGFDWVEDVQRTQLRSFATAFALVFVLVAVFLRSPGLGVAALLPTVLPVVAILGVMGWAGLSLDVGRAMIAAVILGIAVDDAVHLLTVYRRRREQGDDPPEAMRLALLHVGRAVVTTSLALSLGFLTLLLSPWQTISSFGSLVALAILGALAADLFVLPALLFAFTPGTAEPEGVAAGFRSSRAARRSVLTGVVVLPTLLALGVAAGDVFARASAKEIPCWILPNGLVSSALGRRQACPLPAGARVRDARAPEVQPLPFAGLGSLHEALGRAEDTVELRTSPAAAQEWSSVPVRELPRSERLARLLAAALVAALLLFMPLLLVWRSHSPAAPPFAFLYAAISTVAVVLLCGQHSALLQGMGLASAALVPGILVHLALTFPRERRLLREAPGLRAVPYAVSLVLVAVAGAAFHAQPAVWPTLRTVILFLAGGAWLILLAACGFALRESSSALERARARLLWYGALGLAVATLALVPRGGAEPFVHLAVWSVGLPLPIGLAISRYRLFDLEQSARRWIARFVYLAAAAAAMTAVLVVALARPRNVEDGLLLYGLVFACLALLEPLRGRMFGIIETLLSPRLRALRELRDDFATATQELREREHVARRLAETLRRALSPGAGAVLLPSGTGWLPVAAFGPSPPVRPALVEGAQKLLGDRSLVQVSADSQPSPARRALEAAGVEAVVALRRGGETLGMALLAPRRDGAPWSSLELDFLRTVAPQASLALHNARLAEELLRAERRATTGRLAVALAHDVGKEVDWMRRLGRRLASDERLGPRTVRGLGMLRELAEGVSDSLRGFVRESTRGQTETPERMPFDLLLGRALGATARRLGSGRVATSVAPDARRTHTHQDLETVLRNLIENAVLACPSDEPVHVRAALEGRRLRVTVSDRGPGVPAADRERVFDWGFTTRAAAGGCGVGLSLCREIVERLGGRICLEPGEGGGTRARVEIPLARGSGRPAARPGEQW